MRRGIWAIQEISAFARVLEIIGCAPRCVGDTALVVVVCWLSFDVVYLSFLDKRAQQQKKVCLAGLCASQQLSRHISPGSSEVSDSRSPNVVNCRATHIFGSSALQDFYGLPFFFLAVLPIDRCVAVHMPLSIPGTSAGDSLDEKKSVARE